MFTGQRFAMMELTAILSLVVKKFQLMPSDIPFETFFNIIKAKTGVHLTLENRV